jgi:hypothetical protein
METATLADEIANYSVYQLKNKAEQIREMTQEEQEDVSDIIRVATLHILHQNIGASEGT